MPVTLEKIAELHPRLYHMAQSGSWPSICANGLLSTTALLDLYGVSGTERQAIEGRHRRRGVELVNGGEETAWIRDQGPMSDKKLASCLTDGLTTEQWYRMLNGRVFFWLVEARLKTLMSAYAGRQHLILEVDTAELLARHGERVFLAPMNTGCTRPMAFPRGANTFLAPSDYPFAENCKKKRGARKAIVELTVLYAVPDIAELTRKAFHAEMSEGTLLVRETLYER
jgi:hypothetical protein